jgi:hypothetical protein
MSDLGDEERLDRAIDRLDRILHRLDARQARIKHRLANLYQNAFVAFTVIVASISFLVIILSRQVPGMTAAIDDMNAKFASVADNMVRMDRTVADMRDHVESLPLIIANVDRVHGSVEQMSGEVTAMSGALAAIEPGVTGMTINIGDMRGSFGVMEHTIGDMSQDVNHMSQPMRMFNWMNPFR